MHFHRNAKLGLAGRRELVLAIAAGGSMREAAATFNVSTATVHRWWRRWSSASEAERRSLSCLFDRSSRPRRSPRRLAPELEQAICECRRKTGWGPRLVAGATGFCHSTVWKVLHRAGISRPARALREPPTATSGPAPVTCCTWTRASMPASSDPATASPATAAHKTATTETASTSCTPSSTTIPASPTPRSTRTRAPPPPSASSGAPLPSTSNTGSPESG